MDNTSWKVRAYGIYARVVDTKTTSADSVQSTFHVVLCLLYVYILRFIFLFIVLITNQDKLCYTTHAKVKL